MAHEYAEYIWNYFKNKLGNEYGVAGLMGNLQAESGLCPYRVEGDFTSGYTKSVAYTNNVNTGVISKNQFVNYGYNGSTTQKGYGLCQWTYWSRKQGLYELWKNGGYSSIGSIELACDYLWYELGTYGLRDTLKNATSIRQASDVILHDFENPADQSTAVEELRASMGQNWYNQFSGTGGTEPDIPDVPDPEPDPEPEPEGTPSDVHHKQKKMSLLLLITATKKRL